MLIKDYRSQAKGLPDLLPYAALIAPGVVLGKDGSFLAGWKISGPDTASSTDEELAWMARQVGAGIRLLGTGWMLHVDAVRQPHHAYPSEDAGFFPDAVTRLMDEERREYFGSGLCYRTETILVVTYKPALQVVRMTQAIHTGGGAGSTGLEKALEHFQGSLAELEDILSSVVMMERLTETEEQSVLCSSLLSHLQGCVTGIFHPVRVPSTPMYLDAILGGVDLTAGLRPRLGDCHLAVLSLDGLPLESYPSMLAALDSLSLPYRYSTRFICLDQLDGTREINMYRKGWQQQMHRFIDKFLNNASARINRDAAMMRDDAEEAFLEVQSGLVGVGYLSQCIVLMNEDENKLTGQSRDLRRLIQTLGFGCRLESINALEAWLGSHPGNGWANVRRPLVNTLNLAHLLPLATVWTGSRYAPCPFYPPRSRPLAVLATDGSTPFWFNLHAGDLGHTLIFGPTGAGKSTLLGLIAAQFRAYPHASITAFDKGESLLPLCLGVGGSHFNIGHDALSFAPLQSIDNEEEFTWAANWIATCAELQKLVILPGHRNDIHQALSTLRHNPPEMRSMTDFWHVLQSRELKEALNHYTNQGAMGRLLDAQADNLQISQFTVFEIESLMEMGAANMLPVLLYLFHRFEQSLNGQPALLILDEAWVMLGNPVFREKIREWLKVLRKRNCAVVLATQSLSDAERSGIVDVLAESCPTKIYLPNLTAREKQHHLYLGLGLNERQVEIIANATPKRDYYVVSPEGRRLVQLALGPRTLSFIGASDKESLHRVKELAAQYGQKWPGVWLQGRGL